MRDFDWCNVKILHKEQHQRKREFAEMLHIKNNLYTLNKKTDIDTLNPAYEIYLKKLLNRR